MINKILSFFGINKTINIPIPAINELPLLIPMYVKKLEKKYKRDLSKEYLKLRHDGISGRKIIKKTLRTYITGNMQMD